MLPVDGRNPHGRTGLLTHSYLLRGGRADFNGRLLSRITKSS